MCVVCGGGCVVVVAAGGGKGVRRGEGVIRSTDGGGRRVRMCKGPVYRAAASLAWRSRCACSL